MGLLTLDSLPLLDIAHCCLLKYYFRALKLIFFHLGYLLLFIFIYSHHLAVLQIIKYKEI